MKSSGWLLNEALLRAVAQALLLAHWSMTPRYFLNEALLRDLYLSKQQGTN